MTRFLNLGPMPLGNIWPSFWLIASAAWAPWSVWMRVGTGSEGGRRAGVDGRRRFGSRHLASAAVVDCRGAVEGWRVARALAPAPAGRDRRTRMARMPRLGLRSRTAALVMLS